MPENTEWYNQFTLFTGSKLQDSPCTFKHNIEVHLRNSCCQGKAISITYSACVSGALVIHQAKHMRHIILLYVAPFLEKFIERKNVCFAFLYNFYLKHFSIQE
jgi:hypothetical protein